MLKKLAYLLAFIALIAAGAALYLLNKVPTLPQNTDELIATIQSNPLPQLITGKTGFAKNGELSIWYESISQVDSAKATILLIMGHSTTCLAWPRHMFQPFLDAGYQVVRFDNRGVGETNWMEDWDSDHPYTLEDMAGDAISVLDAIGVEKAHIAGVSMGGMIAQRLAISHSQRLLSLTSIMSSGYYDDPELGGVPTGFVAGFAGLILKYVFLPTQHGDIKMLMSIPGLLKGTSDYAIEWEDNLKRNFYEKKHRKGHNPNVGDQHTAAIQTSGSRYDGLKKINIPTLVIHGTSDPLIPFKHAEKYAPMIPNAKTLWLEGMGHDMPKEYTDKMAQSMLNLFKG